MEEIYSKIAGLDYDIEAVKNTSDVGQAGIIDIESNRNLSSITDADTSEVQITNSEKDEATRTSIQIYCSVATKKKFEYGAHLMGDTLSSAGRRAIELYIDLAISEGLKILEKYGKR